MKKIVVVGGGVLGSQIAFQTAYSGFEVVIWLRAECSIGHTQPKLDELKEKYKSAICKMAEDSGKSYDNWCRGIADYDEFDKDKCLEKVEEAWKNIRIELDLKKAVEGAYLVIESMSENMEAKIEFYKRLAKVMDEETILVTNSSTLLPSKLAKYTGRPDRFLALHFANSIWKNNTAEVMAHNKTNRDNFEKVMNFAKDIHMVALPVKKEKSGYLLNSMLIPFLFSGLDLYVNGISDPVSIDMAWTLGTGAPEGPFQILDAVGINTAYNIVNMYVKIPSFIAPYNFKGMASLLKRYIDEGKLGKASGEGFYKYDKEGKIITNIKE